VSFQTFVYIIIKWILKINFNNASALTTANLLIYLYWSIGSLYMYRLYVWLQYIYYITKVLTTIFPIKTLWNNNTFAYIFAMFFTFFAYIFATIFPRIFCKSFAYFFATFFAFLRTFLQRFFSFLETFLPTSRNYFSNFLGQSCKFLKHFIKILQFLKCFCWDS